MAFSATIPAAEMAAANATLEGQGYGPNNFSVPSYTQAGVATYGTLHAWQTGQFFDDVKAIPNVTWSDNTGTPQERVQEIMTTINGDWGGNAQPLEGVVTPGLHYVDTGDTERQYWWVIQQYDTATWPDPTEVPALVREARTPGIVTVWKQPIDQFDAYKLVDPFTGEGERVTHNGSTWIVTEGDGAGNNVWEPGEFGWTEVVDP